MKRKNQIQKDDFMTPKEAMKVLKIGRDTFYRMIADGKVPGAIKFGKQWRIDTEAFWEAVKKESAAG